MKREDRLAKASAALERTRSQLQDWSGPCYQCRHWRSFHEGLGGGVTDYDHCINPVVLAEQPDFVKGIEKREIRCKDARSSGGLCGPMGELFEPPNQVEANHTGQLIAICLHVVIILALIGWWSL